MTRVFITGGSGFIGTNLIGHLQREGIEVLNYDLKAPQDRSAQKLWVKGDILNSDYLADQVKRFGPTEVIHLAARCDLAGKTVADYPANTDGVRNMIAAVKQAPSVRRATFASSRYVHCNEVQPQRDDEYSPFTMYGASKAEGERIVRASGLDIPWVIVRPTSIWGPWFDIPYRGFFDAVRKGLYIHPKGERIYKSYGFVGNVVHELVNLQTVSEEKINKRTLYLADYEPVEISGMAERIRTEFGAPPVRTAPLQVMKAMAKVGDVCKSLGWYNPPLTSFRLSNLRTQMVYNISSTADVVGPLPYSSEQGVQLTVKWMRDSG